MEIGGDIAETLLEEVQEVTVASIEHPIPPPSDIDNAIDLLHSAERPLLVVGKGAAYARAEREIGEIARMMRLPILPSPMGKGVVSDDDDLVGTSIDMGKHEEVERH